MANVDSLSFALLIPFAICFLLIFLVCCFADEIKEICRMPSQLPAYYLTPRSMNYDYDVVPRRNRRRRTQTSRQRRNEQNSQADETHVLIYNEEGRSRNNSERSDDSNDGQRSNRRSVSDNRTDTHGDNGVIICPQRIVSDGQFTHLPQTSVLTNFTRAPHSITRNNGGVLSCDVRRGNTSDVIDFRNANAHVIGSVQGPININRSVPSVLLEQRPGCDNTSRSLRNLPTVIPLGLNMEKDKK